MLLFAQKGLSLDTLDFFAKVCSLRLVFSRKHTKDVLVFFSQLDI